MKPLSTFRILVVSCTALLLASCGGGGSSSDSTPAAGSPNTATLSNTTVASIDVTIDAAIADATRSKIQQVISPFGAAIPGAPVAIPAATGGGDTIVMAVDAEDNILLAALTSSANTTLTVASTAAALARIAFGALPAPLAPAAFQKAVQETPAYPQLVAAVQDAVDAGVPVSASEAVQVAIATVLEQAMPAFSAAIGMAAPAGQKTASASTSTETVFPASNHDREVEAPFPFNTIPDTKGPYSVFIKGGAVDLVNTMQIDWAAFSDKAPDTEVALPSASVTRALANFVTPILGPSPVTVPGNNGLGFFLTVEQTDASRSRNLQAVALDMATVAIGLSVGSNLVSNNCTLSLASAILSPTEADAFAKDPSVDSFLNHFRAVTASPSKMRNVVDRCFADPTASKNAAENAGRFIKGLTKFLTGFSRLSTLNEFIGLSNRIPQLAFYWDNTYTLKVCESAEPKQVVSCVAKMTFEPANIAMIEGAVFEPVIKGFAADGAPTLLPSGLVYEALSDSVSFFKPESPNLFALKLGQAPVRITDPFTKTVSDPYSIDVVTPTFEPNPFSMQVGGTVTGNLKGPDGKTIITSNKGGPTINDRPLLADPLIANPGIASLRASAFNLFTDNAFSITGVATGSTTLSVTNTYTGKTTSARVEVKGVTPPPVVDDGKPQFVGVEQRVETFGSGEFAFTQLSIYFRFRNVPTSEPFPLCSLQSTFTSKEAGTIVRNDIACAMPMFRDPIDQSLQYTGLTSGASLTETIEVTFPDSEEKVRFTYSASF